MKPARILIADDHAIIRDGLKVLLNAQPDLEVVGEASNGQDAFKLADELRPDVVVMDVSMPNGGGAQVTRRIRQSCPSVKVLALSAYEDEVYVRQLLSMGAVGYVLKRAVTDELVRAIRSVLEGGTYLDPLVAGKVAGGFVNRENNGKMGGQLSEREAEVLRLIARGHTNKEIAGQLFLSVKTVETYKTRLGEKLGLHSRAEIVRYALSQGWLQEAPVEQ
jgi:DNA-binding NarL/FixJ family response regulator